MTQTGLNEGMRRLRNMYGEKNFPPERVKLIAITFQILDDSEFAQVVSDIIAHERYAPMLDGIKKHAERFMKRKYKIQDQKDRAELERRKSAGNTCSECNDSGFVFAFKKGTKYSFCFRCPDEDCFAARLNCNPHDIRWTLEMHNHYTKERATESSAECFERHAMVNDF